MITENFNFKKRHIFHLLSAMLVFFINITSAQHKKNIFLDEAPAPHVITKKIKLHRFILDAIPATWKVSNKRNLKLNHTIYRAGTKGIEWRWKGGDNIEIEANMLKELLIPENLKVTFGSGIGFHLWVYSPEAKPTEKINISLTANGISKQLDFGLNYSGWRVCYIQFAEMEDGGDAPDNKIVITAPSAIKKGWFVLDRFEIGKLSAHTMADHQLSYSKNDNHWVNQYWWEQAGKPEVTGTPSKEDIEEFNKIEANIKRRTFNISAVGLSKKQLELVVKRDQSEEIQEAAKRIRKSAVKKYNTLKLDTETPLNLAVPYRHLKVYNNELSWRDVEGGMFSTIMLDYVYHQDETSKKRYLSLLDWLESQGVVAGHSFGSLSHIGYRSRALSVGLFLTKDLLKETGRLEKWTNTLKWLSGFAECYSKKTQFGGVGDDGTISMARLICVLMQDNTPEKLRDATCYYQWFEDVLGVSNGTKGVIKADYSFYHHAIMLAGYWLTNVPQFSNVVMAFHGTKHAKTKAVENLRKNLLVFNRMYRSKTQPFSLRGRAFSTSSDSRIRKASLDIALEGNPFTGEAVDSELASSWLTNRIDEAIPASFKGLQPKNRYHQVLNWGGVSTHSIPGTFAVVSGVNNNLINWDAGIARNYSRYNRCGSLYIFSGTKTSEENGYLDKGWDWSRVPGVTGAYLENEALKEATKGTSGYGDERAFAGGVALDNDGLYGYRISERKSKNWNGNKSYFFFGDRIVCLGSNLTDGDSNQLETTLFQLHLKSNSDAIKVNKENVTAFPYTETFKNTSINITDNKGHGYYIPKGNDAVQIRKQSQTNGNSFGKKASGDFAVAWLNHGHKKSSQYEYMIQLNGNADNPNYTVLKKDEEAHVVKDNASGTVGYVVFKPSKNLPGPISACSRPGLVMVKTQGDALKMSFCDPDFLTNPGGKITRYNIGYGIESPKRSIEIGFKKAWQLESSKANIETTNEPLGFKFSTNNAIIETFDFKILN